MTFTEITAPQRSPEWYRARLGRLTGSVAGDMLAKGKGVTRQKLLIRLALERVTQQPVEPLVKTPAMEWGVEWEDAARFEYELFTKNNVREVGFLSHDTLMAGCSPDGVIGDYSALVSIKCRQPLAHDEALSAGRPPSDAMAQIAHELWMVPTATEHHYWSFNPTFPPGLRGRLLVVTRKSDAITAYHNEAMRFLEDVDRKVAAYLTLADTGAVLRAIQE